MGVEDGATWPGHQLFPSCGFLPLPATFSAHAVKVTVPAGTFDALRIDGEAEWGDQPVRESVWLVRGLGIVKLETRDESWELVSSSLV